MGDHRLRVGVVHQTGNQRWIDIKQGAGYRVMPARRSALHARTKRQQRFTTQDWVPVQCWGRWADAVALWEHITGRPAPAPVLPNDTDDTRPASAFVECLTGQPTGWVTVSDELTQHQQIAACGYGMLPVQVVSALSLLAA